MPAPTPAIPPHLQGGFLGRPFWLVGPQTTSGVHRVPCGSAPNRSRTDTPACRGPGGCTHPGSCTCRPSACGGTWLLPASRFRRYLPGEAGLCQRARDREPCALTRPRVTRPSGRRSWPWAPQGVLLGSHPTSPGIPPSTRWGAGRGASKQDKATYPVTGSHRGERPPARRGRRPPRPSTAGPPAGASGSPHQGARSPGTLPGRGRAGS